MGLQDWNWRLPVELQDVPWDCSCASISWAMRTVGYSWSEADVVTGMYPDYVNEYYGLLDASGAGIVEWLGGVGISAENNPSASWDDVVAAAGHQPMVIGGRAWNHWVGVRVTNATMASPWPDFLALANPAPGWMGIEQVIGAESFQELGPFSAVWFTSW